MSENAEPRPFIRRIAIKNFRSFGPDGVEMEFGHRTLLVGPNNSGKTNVGLALSWVAQAITEIRNAVQENAPQMLFSANVSAGDGSNRHKGRGAHPAVDLEVDCSEWASGHDEPWGWLKSRGYVRDVNYVRVRLTFRSAGSNQGPLLTPVSQGAPLANQNGDPVSPDADQMFVVDGLGAVQIRDGDRRASISDMAALKSLVGAKPLAEALVAVPYRLLRVLNKCMFRLASGRKDPGSATTGLPANVFDGSGQTAAMLQFANHIDFPEVKDKLSRHLTDLLGMRTEFTTEGGVALYHWTPERDRVRYADLSAGTQQLLLLLWCLYRHTESFKVLFLDEPEASLHPGACWRLLTIVKELRPDLQLVVTSHAADLIDRFATNGSVIRLTRPNGHSTEVSPINNVATRHDFLQSLGIGMSSVLLPEVTVFVEGPSDVLYYGWLLQGSRPDLLPGRDYAFSMYGGSLIRRVGIDADERRETLVDLTRMALRGIVIADRDRLGGHLKPGLAAVSGDADNLTKSGSRNFRVVVTPEQTREVEECFPFAAFAAAVLEAVPTLKDTSVDGAGPGGDGYFAALARLAANDEEGASRIKEQMSKKKVEIARAMLGQSPQLTPTAQKWWSDEVLSFFERHLPKGQAP